jgi:protease secretion system outer membrane protein
MLHLKTKYYLISFFFLSLLMNTHSAKALSLLELYQASIANDSEYRTALRDNEAGQQFKIIGKSNLLPNISASYLYNRIDSDVSFGGNGVSRNENRNYNSDSQAIQFRQPIFNLESIALYRKGNAQTNLSDKQLAISKQELIARCISLYSQANFSEDVLTLATVQRDAFKTQVEANKLLSSRGEGTKTALIESQARLAVSEAQLIDSQNELNNAREALALMIGSEVNKLDALAEDFQLLPMDYDNLTAWEKHALENNPEIAAAREELEIAYQEVNKNRAGHLPKLDAIASISKSQSDSVATFNQNIENKSIGMQLNIPIYAGGAVSALTSQAVSNHLKAQELLQTKINKVLLDLRKQFNTVNNSKLKVDALRQSVESTELLIVATKKSLIGGVRTNLDVIQARTQLFETKRDLSQAKYNYLVAYANLKKAAGMLTDNDIAIVTRQFTAEARNFFTNQAQLHTDSLLQKKAPL